MWLEGLYNKYELYFNAYFIKCGFRHATVVLFPCTIELGMKINTSIVIIVAIDVLKFIRFVHWELSRE